MTIAGNPRKTLTKRNPFQFHSSYWRSPHSSFPKGRPSRRDANHGKEAGDLQFDVETWPGLPGVVRLRIIALVKLRLEVRGPLFGIQLDRSTYIAGGRAR